MVRAIDVTLNSKENGGLNMATLELNSSVFEKNFNGIIGTYKRNIKNTEFRYHVITILVTKDGEIRTHMRDYLSFSIAVAETLLFAREFYKTKSECSYYVGLWQRHKDGNCHKVCYSENLK